MLIAFIAFVYGTAIIHAKIQLEEITNEINEREKTTQNLAH